MHLVSITLNMILSSLCHTLRPYYLGYDSVFSLLGNQIISTEKSLEPFAMERQLFGKRHGPLDTRDEEGIEL